MRAVVYALCTLCLCLSSCLHRCAPSAADYGRLESAVTFAADKVYGEYGENIPADFSVAAFKALIKDRMPAEYYRELDKYSLAISPKGTHYLLVVSCPDGTPLLYDYSCTPGVDGAVYPDRGNYDPAMDPCRPPLP